MANGPTDILTALQNGTVAINTIVQAIKTVSSTSSGTITLRLTNGSSI